MISGGFIKQNQQVILRGRSGILKIPFIVGANLVFALPEETRAITRMRPYSQKQYIGTFYVPKYIIRVKTTSTSKPCYTTMNYFIIQFL
jgi:hypothetical protein